MEDEAHYNSIGAADAQWNKLIDFLCCNESMRTGVFAGPLGKIRYDRDWDNAAKELNKLGNAKKSGKKWQEAFEGFKSRAKRAYNEEKYYMSKTGGGLSAEAARINVTDTQRRCLNLIGELRLEGNRAVPDPLQVQLQQVASQPVALQQVPEQSVWWHQNNLQMPGHQQQGAPEMHQPTHHGVMHMQQLPAPGGPGTYPFSQQLGGQLANFYQTPKQVLMQTIHGPLQTQVLQPSVLHQQQVQPLPRQLGDNVYQTPSSQTSRHQQPNLMHTPPWKPSPSSRKKLNFCGRGGSIPSGVGELSIASSDAGHGTSFVEAIELLNGTISSAVDVLEKVSADSVMEVITLSSNMSELKGVLQNCNSDVKTLSHNIAQLKSSIDILTETLSSLNFAVLQESVNNFKTSIDALTRLS